MLIFQLARKIGSEVVGMAQVKCCECGYESNTMESFMDICLDISRAPSLTMALERYTKPEMLDRENKYKCPKQGRLVRARKTITIERSPNVLVFQLKRFEYSMYGSKIGKKVTCPWERLNGTGSRCDGFAGCRILYSHGEMVCSSLTHVVLLVVAKAVMHYGTRLGPHCLDIEGGCV